MARRTPVHWITSPFRKFFNLRFENVGERVDEVGARAMESYAATTNEARASSDYVAEMARAVELSGRRLLSESDRVDGQIAELKTSAAEIRELRAEQIAAEIDPDEIVSRLFDVSLPDLGPNTALLLNKGRLLDGIGAPALLEINHGIALEYVAGGQRVAGINERLMENPYVFGAIRDLTVGASIIDIGSVESMLPLSFAMQGYQSIALDPRGYSYIHPGLTSVVASIADWSGPDHPVDAITCVSAIEHFGIGAYGLADSDDRLDLEAMTSFKSWLAPTGRLVLTVPFGAAIVDEEQRVYDTDGISELMDGFEVIDRECYRRVDAVTWERLDDTAANEPWPTAAPPGVLCLTAIPL